MMIRHSLFCRLDLCVLAAESLYAACGIHQFLLAGEEGMAIRANLYVNVPLVGGASGETVAARAHDAHFVVSGMDSCFHDFLCLNANYLILRDGRWIQQRFADSRGWCERLISGAACTTHFRLPLSADIRQGSGHIEET
jgi:hypothetical protein